MFDLPQLFLFRTSAESQTGASHKGGTLIDTGIPRSRFECLAGFASRFVSR